MTLAQLLPQAKIAIVTTPQPAAQTVARRAADMAAKFDLELLGVIENMSGFTTPDGERFTIFGEGGGQLLADELDIPLLGKVPLSDASTPTRARPLSPPTLTRPPRRRSARRPAASSPPRPRSCPCSRRRPRPPSRRPSGGRRCRSSSSAIVSRP
jgi:ATP-binding protein involved in chromosome partitioning